MTVNEIFVRSYMYLVIVLVHVCLSSILAEAEANKMTPGHIDQWTPSALSLSLMRFSDSGSAQSSFMAPCMVLEIKPHETSNQKILG